MLSSLTEALQGLASSLRRQDGQALAEYSLVLVLVSVACISGLALLAAGIIGLFGNVTGSLP